LKVLVYAINGLGMGHLNRALVLARTLKAAAPSTEIHFIVDSPHFGLVADSGFGVTKFPDRRHRLGFHRGREQRYVELPELFDVVLRDWQPDAMWVDFLCKRALFERIKERGVYLAALLRKQRPASLKQLSLSRGAALVDRWLIPHTAQDWPVRDLPRRLRRRATYLGPVSRSLDPALVPELRRSLVPGGSGPLVLVTIGGGGAPESQHTLDVAEEALVRSGRAARLLMVYGPNYPGEIPASGPRGEVFIERRRFVGELPEVIAASDLVISNAGYNTMLELRAAGTPALILPLSSTGRDDQNARAATFASDGRGLIARAELKDMAAKIEAVLDSAAINRFAIDPGPDPSLQGRVLLDALSDPGGLTFGSR
jgi:predicted glycosyltransferase